jgi:hypothetical protein
MLLRCAKAKVITAVFVVELHKEPSQVQQATVFVISVIAGNVYVVENGSSCLGSLDNVATNI